MIMKISTYILRRYILIVAGLVLFLTFCEKPERDVQVITLQPVDSLILYARAKLQGDVTDKGSKPIEDHGLFLSLSDPPDKTNSVKKSLGPRDSKGTFQAQFIDLLSNTNYYYCAFVSVNSVVFYGETYQFRTKVTQAAIVTAGSISDITISTAKLSGNIVSDGGETVTKRGLCWNITPNPTIAICLDTTVNGSGTGSFAGLIHGLSPATQYYVRAYAINAKGTSYNNSDITFTTFNIPTVTTTGITFITGTSAASGGNVTNEGGLSVASRGVCWSTDPTPTVALTTKTTDGTGQGTFTSNITNLAPGTTYYVRAYAINNAGIAYGNELSFSTAPAVAPSLSTAAITSITSTTATSGGTITSDGGASVTARGVCWSTSVNPTISNSKTTDGTGTGSFGSILTGLIDNTTYYVRAYATNNVGTGYGNELNFIARTISIPPTATTTAATSVTNTTAALNGTVNANDLSTIITFEYGNSPSYGLIATAIQSPVTGNSLTSVSASIAGLTAGKTYYYRVKAVSTGGTTYGNQFTFMCEGFDGYNAGSFPINWTPDANGSDISTNYVDNSIFYDGEKSLKLFGSIGGCWSGVAYHIVVAARPFEIELAIRNGNEVLSGCHPIRALVGFRKGTNWMDPADRWFIKFNSNGKVYGSGGTELSNYNNSTWYLIKIKYEIISSSEIKLSYWINNNYAGSESLSPLSEENLLDNIELEAGEGSVWFDKIKIIEY